MNKRIQELAKEARLLTGRSIGEIDLEKFAELIVRECDRYVAEQYDEMEPWMQPGDLLKHFGVKE